MTLDPKTFIDTSDERRKQVSLSILGGFAVAANVAKTALQEKVATAEELEFLLERAVGRGFAAFNDELIRRLERAADQRLEAAGLPDSEFGSCGVSIEGLRISFHMDNVEVSFCRSLRRCSTRTRRRVFRLLRELQLPIIGAWEVADFRYALADALPQKYPNTPRLSEQFCKKVWEQAILNGECEDLAQEGEPPRMALYGIGEYPELRKLLRMHHAAVREFTTSLCFSARAEARWTSVCKVLRRLRAKLPKKNPFEFLERNDTSDLAEGFVLVPGPRSMDLLNWHFDAAHQNGQEAPGGDLDSAQVGGVVEALVWIKGAQGVLNLFRDDGGSRP